METTTDEKPAVMRTNGKVAYQQGVLVFVILVVLTAGEYGLGAIGTTWGWALVLIAILKAAMIIRDYMHIGRLFHSPEGGE